MRELDQGEAPSPACLSAVCFPSLPHPHRTLSPSCPPSPRACVGPGPGRQRAPVGCCPYQRVALASAPGLAQGPDSACAPYPSPLGWGLPRWPAALPSEAWPARALGAPPSLWQGKRVTLGVRPPPTATGPASLPSTCSLLSASRRGRQAGAEGRGGFGVSVLPAMVPLPPQSGNGSVSSRLCPLPWAALSHATTTRETRICGGVGARLPRLGRNHPPRPDPQTPLMLCPCPDVAAEDPTRQTCPPSGRARQGHPQAGPRPKTTSPAAPCWTLSLKLQPLLLAPVGQRLGGMVLISCIGSLKVCASVRVCVCVHWLSGGGAGVAWEARKERLCLHYPRHHHHTPSQRTHRLMVQEMGVE